MNSLTIVVTGSGGFIGSRLSHIISKEFPEDIPCENLGATKLASESLLKSRAVAGQFKAISFRIGTVYGPGAGPEQFIPQAIMKLSSPDPIVKFGARNIKKTLFLLMMLLKPLFLV